MKKSIISLADFQKWMQQRLLDPSGQMDPEGQFSLDNTSSFTIEDIIKPSKRLAPWQHLAIYQHGYTARLRDCMAKQFTALEYALSEELFEAFADEYLKKYPSESYNLTNLGNRFTTYLEETRPDKDQEIKEDWPDFMIELAQFESAINRIFDEKIDQNYQLATSATPKENLRLISGFHLFAFKFPVRSFYSAVANGATPDLPLPAKSHCIVLRQGYKLALFDLYPEQYQLLSYLQNGYTLFNALDTVSNTFQFNRDELEEAWLIWLKKWLKTGFFREGE